jgi:hypothetical protein
VKLRKGAKTRTIADRECGARIVHADPIRDAVVLGCRGQQLVPGEERKRKRSKKRVPPRTRWPLWLVAKGLRRDLQLDLGPTGNDRWPMGSPRLLALHAGANTSLLDLETHKLEALPPRSLVVATHDTKALVLRGQTLELLDANNAKRLLERTGVDRTPQLLVRNASAYVSPFVVDLAQARILGRCSDPVLALAEDGQCLKPQAGSTDPDSLPTGPLVWTAPEGESAR